MYFKFLTIQPAHLCSLFCSTSLIVATYENYVLICVLIQNCATYENKNLKFKLTLSPHLYFYNYLNYYN